MNQEQLGPLVSSWLKEENRPPSDATTSVHTAMNAATRTRQLSRWRWLPPFVHRMPDPPSEPHAVAQTDDYQPGPIPASNGQTPTVLGRTQSMLSPVKAITAGALVFALGGVLLIAQPFDRQAAIVPGAATETGEATAEGWTYLTWTSNDAGVSPYNDGGTWRASGVTLEASDPRASGLLDLAWNATGGGPDDRAMSLWEFRYELTNEDGSWSGTGSTVASHEGGDEGPETSIEPWRFEGTGAYEGLSLIMVTTNRDSDEERWGMIVPIADVPQAPDPVATD